MNDNYYVKIILNESLKSDDPKRKVGCCIVKDSKVISKGYNCPPKGYEKHMTWELSQELNNKHLYVVHAELNAILKAKSDISGSILYTTFFPCNECCKAIVQSGIREIVFIDDNYNNKITLNAAKRILDICGITYRRFIYDS